jgi:hypothetical protein
LDYGKPVSTGAKAKISMGSFLPFSTASTQIGHHACIAAIRRMVSSFSGHRLEQPAYNLIDNDTNDV